MIVCKSERLNLRTWDLERDFDAAFAIWGDKRVTDWFMKEPMDRELVRESLVKGAEHFEKHGTQYFACEFEGEVVGACGLRWEEEQDAFELGFHFNPKFWGKGFATEAAFAVILYARGKLGLKRIVAGHHPDNLASKRVLEKLGFEYFKTDYYEPNDIHEPWYQLWI